MIWSSNSVRENPTRIHTIDHLTPRWKVISLARLSLFHSFTNWEFVNLRHLWFLVKPHPAGYLSSVWVKTLHKRLAMHWGFSHIRSEGQG